MSIKQSQCLELVHGKLEQSSEVKEKLCSLYVIFFKDFKSFTPEFAGHELFKSLTAEKTTETK